MDTADRELLSNLGMGSETLQALHVILRDGRRYQRMLAEAYLQRVRAARGDADAIIEAVGSASAGLELAVKARTGHDDWTR